MGIIIDITGKKFGRLTAIKHVDRTYWLFKCECGKEKIINKYPVTIGRVVSCGCYHHEIMKKRIPKNKSHGMKNTPEYNIWSMMKNRCKNPNCNRHHIYLDKGIKVCDRWLNSFENFLADMGKRPSPNHSIDRIDANGDYTPENCRWATAKEQANNLITNVIIEHNGVSHTLAEWCDIFGIDYKLAHNRHRNGFTFEDIFNKEHFSGLSRYYRIRQYDYVGNLLGEFKTAKDAELLTGIKAHNIVRAYSSESKLACGFRWERVKINND